MFASLAFAPLSARTTDHLLTSSLWWFAVIWLGCLGGCVGSFLTVVWDRTGERYGRGVGLGVWIDGREIARSTELARVTAPLPPRQ